MENVMPCGKDDERLWDRYESEPEDDDPRTETEKRLMWIEDEWAQALEADDYEAWHDIRMMVHGALQAIAMAYTLGRIDEVNALRELGNIAFERGIVCIKAGKYEGAPR